VSSTLVLHRGAAEGGDKLRSMLIASFAVHVVLFLCLIITIPGLSRNRINAPLSYMPVTIVGAGELAAAGKPAPKDLNVKKATNALSAQKPSLMTSRADLKKLTASKIGVENRKLTPERISPAEEKVQPSPQHESAASETPESSGQESPAAAGTGRRGSGRAGGGPNAIPPELAVYISIVIDQVAEAWFLPPALEQEASKNKLMAIISIRIDREGNVTLQAVEQRSGNALYDNYAVTAIKKVQASSLPPLPEVYREAHLDLGLRFRPSEVGL